MPDNLTYDNEIDELLDRIEKSHIQSRVPGTPRIPKIDLSFGIRNNKHQPSESVPSYSARSPTVPVDKSPSDRAKRVDAGTSLSTERRLASFESSLEGIRNTLMAKLETLTDRLERSLKLVDDSSHDKTGTLKDTFVKSVEALLESHRASVLKKFDESFGPDRTYRRMQESEYTDSSGAIESLRVHTSSTSKWCSPDTEDTHGSKETVKKVVHSDQKSFKCNNFTPERFILLEIPGILGSNVEKAQTQTDNAQQVEQSRAYLETLKTELVVLEERLNEAGAFHGSVYEFIALAESEMSQELQLLENYIETRRSHARVMDDLI